MKKLALSSLIAVFAVSGANAANVIDGNPLYMPQKGHFYSVSALESTTRDVDGVMIGEEFGYGITNRLAVNVSTDFYQEDWFRTMQWNTMGLELAFRAIDDANWKLDAVGGYGVGPVWSSGGRNFLHGRFMNKDETRYAWTVGLRGGYTTADFTIAGHIMMDYVNTESFNWNKDKAPAIGTHTLRAGVDGQLVLNKNWNLVSGAEYTKLMDHYNEVMGSWELTFGANYNIDATKFVGVYLTKQVDHTRVPNDGTWEFRDGFGLGAKFGIDF